MEPLRRRWWVVGLVTVALSALVYVYYSGSEPTYTASTTVYVQPSPLDTLLGDASGSADADRTVNNQARLLETPAVAGEVAGELNFEGDPRELLSLVTATAAEDSDFMLIEATTSDPDFSADVANGFAEGFVRLDRRRLAQDATEAREQIQRELSQLAPTRDNRTVRRDLQQRLARIALVEAVPTQAGRQIDRAIAPDDTSAPDPLQSAIFAGLLGLVLGCALVYALRALDRLVPPSTVEAEYGTPLLGSIPENGTAAADAKGLSPLPLPLVEPIRTVRTTLVQDPPGGTAPSTVLIMSAIPGEGKSLLTKAMALEFQEAGRKVLVVDADLRRPVLHAWFEAHREPGLSDILQSEATIESSIQEISVDIEVATEVETNGKAESEPEPDSVAERAAHGRASVGLKSADAKNASEQPERAKLGTGEVNGRVVPAIHLVASGSPVRDPAALLSNGQTAKFLDEAATSYDVVLIDSSPLLAVSDVIPLATAVDGVIAVTRSNLTTRDEAQRFRRTLDRRPDVTVLGLILNGAPNSHAPRYYDARYT